MRSRAEAMNSLNRSMEPSSISPPSQDSMPVGTSGGASGRSPVSTGTPSLGTAPSMSMPS